MPESHSIDAVKLAAIIQSRDFPVHSRLQGLSWLLDIWPGARSRALEESHQKAPSCKPDSESITEPGSTSQPVPSAEVSEGNDNRREGAAPGDTQNSMPKQLQEKVTLTLEVPMVAALLSAAEDTEVQLRLAVAECLTKLLSDGRAELGLELRGHLTDVAIERLCDIDPNVQYKWQHLLSQHLAHSEASLCIHPAIISATLTALSIPKGTSVINFCSCSTKTGYNLPL